MSALEPSSIPTQRGRRLPRWVWGLCAFGAVIKVTMVAVYLVYFVCAQSLESEIALAIGGLLYLGSGVEHLFPRLRAEEPGLAVSGQGVERFAIG